MTGIKTRLHQLLRRSSTHSTATAASKSMSSLRTEVSTANEAAAAESSGVTETTGTTSTVEDRHNISTDYEPANHPAQVHTICPALTLEAPTPIYQPVQSSTPDDIQAVAEPSHSNLSLQSSARQSHHELPVNAHTTTLLDPEAVAPSHLPTGSSNFSAAMLNRKIWVKRPNASATLVQIREDDLVDDVRDMILRKYGNSLGRSFDAPDILLRIVPRDSTAKAQDRVLGPEEEMCRTLDAYYPGGQNVNEALIIEVPKPRTPKPSPRIPVYYTHNDDSAHHLHQQSDYFPPMPVVNPSPAALSTISHERPAHAHAPHSIAVLQTSQLPPLPSPGGRRPAHALRPKNARHATASPITLSSIPHSSTSNRPSNRPRHDSSASESKHSATNAPVPTPPVPAESSAHQNSTPPTPRLASPRPIKKPKKPKAADSSNLPAGLLDGSVPPINVLIVEDNIINLRVLGAFMQRLKVRWQKAMDGREAVTKWRTGGFHLVLMDIQLPIMDGLEATREIRRLERVNSIGVFSSGSSEAPNNRLDNGNYGSEIKEDDKLGDRSLFKSPVIIVALTASSLQSDRHEALAAGCNDFLTKPVNFVWLERKVKEWGCMQALIDFDGWRRWKDFATSSDTTAGTSKLSTSYSAIAPRKGKTPVSTTQAANPTNGEGPSNSDGVVAKPKDEEKKMKRRSMGILPPPTLPEEKSLADADSPGV